MRLANEISKALPEMEATLDLNRPAFNALAHRYHLARQLREEFFVFRGQEMFTPFAGYLLEYTAPKLGLTFTKEPN